jgi:hypothetical protein
VDKEKCESVMPKRQKSNIHDNPLQAPSQSEDSKLLLAAANFFPRKTFFCGKDNADKLS